MLFRAFLDVLLLKGVSFRVDLCIRSFMERRKKAIVWRGI